MPGTDTEPDRETTIIHTHPIGSYGDRFSTHCDERDRDGWNLLRVVNDPKNSLQQKLTWERKMGDKIEQLNLTIDEKKALRSKARTRADVDSITLEAAIDHVVGEWHEAQGLDSSGGGTILG